VTPEQTARFSLWDLRRRISMQTAYGLSKIAAAKTEPKPGASGVEGGHGSAGRLVFGHRR
jgi:hypothetical protein